MPKVQELARELVDHATLYALSARRISSLNTPQEWARVVREARSLYRTVDTTGEPGEMILYLLIESVLNAPQIVAKMELKTNPNMEVHGSDGIHFSWDADDGCADIYFGEAKLYDSVYSAMDAAFESIASFHQENLFSHEVIAITNNFKYVEQPLRDAVIRYISSNNSDDGCRVNHAILIGYNWDQVSGASSVFRSVAEFRALYRNERTRLQRLLQSRMDNFSLKYLRFEVFFLPFASVQDLRSEFLRILRGGL